MNQTYSSHPRGRANYRRGITRACSQLRPPERITVSEWADRHRKLSSEASAELGAWRTDRAEYQREIMDAFSDPSVESVVVMSSAQVGKTEVILNVIGHLIQTQPCPILVVEPTLEMAQAFSKDRFDPMVRDSRVLASRVSKARAKSGDSTILHKGFHGGHVSFVGANSPAGLAGRPIRVALIDEADRCPITAGIEGDAVRLAVKRTAAFWNRKLGYFSTPTVRGVSRIERLYEESDQRVYKVPCPYCGTFQRLVFGNLKWTTKTDGIADLDTVHYECEACRRELFESDKLKMVRLGVWEAQRPQQKQHAGFHISELYSTFSTWRKLVENFLIDKKSEETLRTFINTSLGETWDDSEVAQISDTALAARLEDYEKVPDGALVLTLGVDVQDTYLVATVIGWGKGEEAWVVDHRQILGSPADAEPWAEIDKLRAKEYETESGLRLKVVATCVDSGGHFTEEVYRYTKQHELERVFSIKGLGGTGHPIVSKFFERGRVRAKLFTVGVDTAKELLFSRFANDTFGSGYIHFTKHVCDADYFRQLTAEKQVKKFVRGFARVQWQKIRARNEALDCFVYNIAALRLLNPDFDVLDSKQAAQLAEVRKAEAEAETTEPETKPEPKPEQPQVQQHTDRYVMRKPKRGGNWVTGF